MSKQTQEVTIVEAEQSYKQIIKEEERSQEIIKRLNKLYKVDRILLQHAYDTYTEKQDLQKSNEYKLIDKFYQYVLNNLLKIQKSYLEVPNQESGSAYHYQINKNSVSKFIRDQNQHFRGIFNRFSLTIGEQDKAIKGEKIYKFIEEIFHTKYTAVILNGVNYFQTDRSQQFLQTIQSYFDIVKDMPQKQFQRDTLFNQSEILDILSFWIKQKQNDHFFLLYARTQQKLESQKSYLKDQSEKINLQQRNQSFSHPALIQQSNTKTFKTQQQENGGQQHKERQQTKKKLNIFEKYRSNKIKQQNQWPVYERETKKTLSKKEQLEAMIPELFVFGCKRRYPLPKGMTFDQIQAQTKMMNLQKFMSFCQYYHVTKYLSRQIICEMFKIYALNRLVLDSIRFKNILIRMIETDDKIIPLFLKDNSPQSKLNKNTKLSEYKFKLRPVNGRSIQTLQQQLSQLKTKKSKEKNDNLQRFYSKKRMNGSQSKFKQKKSISTYLLPTRANLLDLETLRDDSFDPEKFFGNDEDELLTAYESKIQRKQTSGLESVLSRRLQKGDKVLKKIATTNRNLQLYN